MNPNWLKSKYLSWKEAFLILPGAASLCMRTFVRSTRGGISCSQSLWRSSQQTAETISSHSPGSSETKCLQSKAEIIHTEPENLLWYMYQIITFSLLLKVHVNKADGIFLLTFIFASDSCLLPQQWQTVPTSLCLDKNKGPK